MTLNTMITKSLGERKHLRVMEARTLAPRAIQHKGWYCDTFCNEVFTPVVVLLPHGRRLAGYVEPWNDGVIIDPCILSNDHEAALVADNITRIAAEQ